MIDYDGADLVTGKSIYRRHLSYVSFALTSGYQLDRLSINPGLFVAYSVAATEDGEENSPLSHCKRSLVCYTWWQILSIHDRAEQGKRNGLLRPDV